MTAVKSGVWQLQGGPGPSDKYVAITWLTTLYNSAGPGLAGLFLSVVNRTAICIPGILAVAAEAEAISKHLEDSLVWCTL